MAFSDALILGFDTSAAHCAAALLCGDRVIATQTEEMKRGQAERLMPLLEEVLHQGGAGWSDLTALGVGIGPGNFTGIRISVSAARGLSLSLDIPAIGVSTFDAIKIDLDQCVIVSAVKGPADKSYVQIDQDVPFLCGPDDEISYPAKAEPHLVAYPSASALASDFGLPEITAKFPLAEAIARKAMMCRFNTTEAPAPLYIKSADAAPARDQAPRILG